MSNQFDKKKNKPVQEDEDPELKKKVKLNNGQEENVEGSEFSIDQDEEDDPIEDDGSHNIY